MDYIKYTKYSDREYLVYTDYWENGVVKFECPFCRQKQKCGTFNYDKPIIHQHGYNGDETEIYRGAHCIITDIPYQYRPKINYFGFRIIKKDKERNEVFRKDHRNICVDFN